MTFILRYTETIESFERSIDDDTKKVNKLIKELNLVEKDGACIQALKTLNVERQAYHSLSFIGNHCHKLLKVRIIMTSFFN